MCRMTKRVLLQWVVQSVTLTNFLIFIAETSSWWDVCTQSQPTIQISQPLMLELRHDLNFWDGLPLLLEYYTKTLKDKNLPLIMMHIKSENAVYLRYQCKVIGLNRSYAIIGGFGELGTCHPVQILSFSCNFCEMKG